MIKPMSSNQSLSLLLTGLLFPSPVLANELSPNSTDIDPLNHNTSAALILPETESLKGENIDSLVEEESALLAFNHEATKWADSQREEFQGILGRWAYAMDDWFGEPDPNNPASANLRVVIDTRWADDPVEGSFVTVKPRIRGRLRLPVLEKRLSLIIGDEDLDEERLLTKGSDASNLANNDSYQDKTYDRKKTRNDNASIALRWSKIEETLGFDADVGVRSGDDVYLKLSSDRDLYQRDQWKVSTHNYYRYGSSSEHTLKGEVNFQYALDHNSFVNNNINVRYRYEGEEEETNWSNELRQIHFYDNDTQLSYGLSAFGEFEHNKPSLNSYGPTISYRQPFWRDWLYLQTELNYFNDKAEDKGHFPSALVRLEALF